MTKLAHFKAKQWVQRNKPICVNGESVIIRVSHPLYKLRYTLLTRCYNPKPSDYNYYKGKGIQVCDEWKNDPDSFFLWALTNGWQKGLTLDRINPDKDYEPSNCQFISASANLKKMHIDNDMHGEKAPRVKLNQLQVDEIRKRLDNGVTCARLAKDYCVAPSTISAIKLGQNWKI